MQGFEWPEFWPGDRVLVRRPSEEAPAFDCGCRPAEVWDRMGYEPVEAVVGEKIPPGTVAKCTLCRNPSTIGDGEVRVFEPISKCYGVSAMIDLELLEAADD